MNDYEPHELLPRLSSLQPQASAALSRLLCDAGKGAAALQILNDADYLDAVIAEDFSELPPSFFKHLTAEDIALVGEAALDPDEFESVVGFYEEIHPGNDHGLGRSVSEVYDEALGLAAACIQDEILSDREAWTVVMELALGLSHRFDKDQQAVADDIVASFTYSYGVSPEDYADSLGNAP